MYLLLRVLTALEQAHRKTFRVAAAPGILFDPPILTGFDSILYGHSFLSTTTGPPKLELLFRSSS